MKINHNIVYSTKGGCGKTTFSFWLAHVEHQTDDANNLTIFVNGSANEANCHNQQKLISNVHAVCKEPLSVNCLIDLDLLGSSTTRSLGINTSNNPNAHVITLQELIKGTKKPNEIKLWNHKIKDAKQLVFIIPVDAAESEKEIFYYKRNNTPLLKYEEITVHLEYIQKAVELYLKSKGFNNNDTLNFIYDLPLNADGYTEAIIDEIFKQKEISKDKAGVRLYLVSNSESMLKCNIDWAEKFFSTFQNRKCEVIIVHNSNISYSTIMDHDKLDAWIAAAVDKDIKCSEKVKNIIQYKMFNKNTRDSSLHLQIDIFKQDDFSSIDVVPLFEQPTEIKYKVDTLQGNKHE